MQCMRKRCKCAGSRSAANSGSCCSKTSGRLQRSSGVVTHLRRQAAARSGGVVRLQHYSGKHTAGSAHRHHISLVSLNKDSTVDDYRALTNGAGCSRHGASSSPGRHRLLDQQRWCSWHLFQCSRPVRIIKLLSAQVLLVYKIASSFDC